MSAKEKSGMENAVLRNRVERLEDALYRILTSTVSYEARYAYALIEKIRDVAAEALMGEGVEK